MMPSESEMDNILVHQKDRILAFINAGAFYEASLLLGIVFELWQQCGYGYKYNELKARIPIQ